MRAPATNIHETVGPITVRRNQQVTLRITVSDDYGYVFVDGVNIYDRPNSYKPTDIPLKQYLQNSGRHVLQVDCEDIGAGGDNHWTLSFGLSFEGDPTSGFDRKFFDHLRHGKDGEHETKGVQVLLDVR